MKIQNTIAAFVVIFAFLSQSAADVVVRDSQTSEEEFQAEALALGHTPIAEWLANEENRSISPSLKEVFQARLVDAQSAWIRRTAGSFDISSIDRLLDLETEADWSSAEREAFAVFANRKKDASPAAMRGATSAPPINQELRPSFPSDVTAILLNGREISKVDFESLEIPKRATRITLLSNAFAPATVKFSGFETSWPRFERRSWVTENCGQIPAPKLGSDAIVTILASNRCRDVVKISAATAGDRELIDRFGIDRLQTTPMREPVKPKSWVERPWVWAAVGVLAIGAAIAIERSQNQASLQPVSREGW
jgi:hypothetical protein